MPLPSITHGSLPWILDRLEQLVKQESPTESREAVNAAASLVCSVGPGQSAAVGVQRHRQGAFGDVLEIRFGAARDARRPVLLLGHLDTVWPVGTLRAHALASGRGPPIRPRRARYEVRRRHGACRLANLARAQAEPAGHRCCSIARKRWAGPVSRAIHGAPCAGLLGRVRARARAGTRVQGRHAKVSVTLS